MRTRLLYLLKHFPSVSQTFVVNEIAALLDQGCDVRVVSAIDLREDVRQEAFQAHDMASRTTYLEHGGFYPYANPGLHGDAEVADAVASLWAHGRPGVSAAELRELADVIASDAPDEASARRALLDAVAVLALMGEVGTEHLHADFAEDNVRLAHALSRVTGVPFTFKMRAYDIFAEPPARLATWAAAAHRVVTISRYNQRYLEDVLGVPADRIAVVHDGVRVDRIRPRQGAAGPSCRILAVSRLVEKKGYPVLLEACGILRDRGLAFTCDVYGDGPLRESLGAQRDRLGLAGAVTFRGRGAHGDVLAAMQEASVFVAPSVQAASGDRDATPNALLEAMATALPVVSTRISAIPEVVDDGVDGFLVNPGDAQALADVVLMLHHRPDVAAAAGRRARRTVERRFRIERTAAELLALVRAPRGTTPALAGAA